MQEIQVRSNLWVRKIPWRRKWQPTAVFLPGESHGQRSLVGYRPGRHKESDMTKRLSTHTHTLLYLPFRAPSHWGWAEPVTVMRCQHHDLVTYELTVFIKSAIIPGGRNRVGGAFRRWTGRAMHSCWLQVRKQMALRWTALERGCLWAAGLKGTATRDWILPTPEWFWKNPWAPGKDGSVANPSTPGLDPVKWSLHSWPREIGR